MCLLNKRLKIGQIFDNFYLLEPLEVVVYFRGRKFGRIARFYISTESQDCLQYAKNGNKVPKSDNAELLLDLPPVLPNDINYNYYVEYADRMLYDIGYKVKNRVDCLF